MDQIDAAGLVGAIAASAVVYATARRLRRPPGSDSEEVRGAAPTPEARPTTAARDNLWSVAGLRGSGLLPVRGPAVLRSRTPRSADAVAEAPWELLSLIGTMQWDRALAWIEAQASAGGHRPGVVSLAEAAALERIRALPESEARLSLGGYRLLAALAPAKRLYADKVAQAQAALEARRQALLAGLTQDEDRFEPGTVWYNHPYNLLFDDVRRPIWLYIGQREGGAPRLRLRTTWLGEMRILVRGLDAVHDGIPEVLTRGAYKIDPDALGWEWRDEPADIYQIEVLRSIVGAGDVTLRYRGDPWTCEAPLAEEEKVIVGEMIELYDLMCAAAPAEHQAQAA